MLLQPSQSQTRQKKRMVQGLGPKYYKIQSVFFPSSPEVYIKLNLLKSWQTCPRSKVKKWNCMLSNAHNNTDLQLLIQNHFYLTCCSLGLSQGKVQICYWAYFLFLELYLQSNKEVINHSKSNNKGFGLLQTCCLTVSVELHFNMISAVFWIAFTDNLHN